MASALAGIFREYDLVFSVPGAYDAVDPATGNPVPSLSNPETVRVYLKVSQNPAVQRSVKQVVDHLGADVTYLTLSGRLVEPTTLPSGVKAQMTCPLTINGESGVFHLAPTVPAPLAELDTELGQAITGVWVRH